MSLEFVQDDIQRIMNDKFTEIITFEAPDETSVQIRGFVSKHNLSIDPSNGLPVNTRNAHISVFENNLIDAGYTTRNADNEIELYGHKVTFSLFERSLTFLINEAQPSDTQGVVVCTLGEYV